MKHYFETRDTSIIQALVESYTNLIAGKTINEIESITQSSFKKLEALGSGRVRNPTVYKKLTN